MTYAGLAKPLIILDSGKSAGADHRGRCAEDAQDGSMMREVGSRVAEFKQRCHIVQFQQTAQTGRKMMQYQRATLLFCKTLPGQHNRDRRGIYRFNRREIKRALASCNGVPSRMQGGTRMIKSKQGRNLIHHNCPVYRLTCQPWQPASDYGP